MLQAVWAGVAAFARARIPFFLVYEIGVSSLGKTVRTIEKGETRGIHYFVLFSGFALISPDVTSQINVFGVLLANPCKLGKYHPF